MAERANNKSVLATDAKLRELVNRLKEVAAANLESVILYGSAARGDFHPGHSDLNILCMLSSLAIEEITRAALFHRGLASAIRRCFFHRAARYSGQPPRTLRRRRDRRPARDGKSSS